jgi:hypothetical protein
MIIIIGGLKKLDIKILSHAKSAEYYIGMNAIKCVTVNNKI